MVSFIRIGCLIVVRVHRLTDKIDILPALFIIGRQCKVRWQILHCGTGKGDGFFIVLIFQMIRQKNVLIACFGCFPVDDLGSQVLIIHRINAGISAIRYRIAPQCHNDLGALGWLSQWILPNLCGSKRHVSRNALGHRSAIVTQRDVVSVVSGTVIIAGFVILNRRLGD